MKYTEEAINKRRKIFNLIKRLLAISIAVILIPIIIYCILLIFQTSVLNKDMPTIFGKEVFIMVSESMEPEINVGDIVILEKYDNQELKIGNIISYKYNEEIITHRIIGIIEIQDKIIYKTKGDNNLQNDEISIEKSDIIGVYSNKIPALGSIFLLLRSEIVIIAIFVLIVLIYEYNVKKEVTENKRRLKREKLEKEYLNKK